MSHMFEMAQLLIDLYQQLLIADAMTDQALNERLKEKLTQEARAQSYAAVRDEVADEFFKDFMREHSADIQQLVQAHTARLQGGGKRRAKRRKTLTDSGRSITRISSRSALSGIRWQLPG